MKRLLLLCLLVFIIMPVSASFSTTFQDQSSWISQVGEYSTGGTDCGNYIVESGNGGNSYYQTCAKGATGYYRLIRNSQPEATTYAAATITGNSGYSAVRLFSSTGAETVSWLVYSGTYGSAPYRLEVKVVGNTAYLYLNGKRIQSATVTSNPYYVGFGTHSNTNSEWYAYVDDFVYGSTENRYIFGMPKEQTFMLVKDMLNPAASGFAFIENGTIVNSNNMTTTWGRGDSNESVVVSLKNYVSGVTVDQFSTITGSMSGSKTWALQEAIFNNPNADYGYYVTTVSGSSEYSTTIPYIGYGAAIAWDKDDYYEGNTATITYSIIGGGYWDLSTYTYRIDVMDVFGNVIHTYPVITQTGSESFEFTDSDSDGVYYAVVIATESDEDEIWMNLDYAELLGYISFTGYVNDAENTLPIAVANVSITQGAYASNTVTVDGNYTSDPSIPFGTGATITINVTATGYQQYTDTFTPAIAKAISLNFTLVPTTPTVTGIGLGGVCRDSVYGRPVSGCTAAITNATHSESYSVTANAAGYYLADESDSIFLTNGRCYSVVGSKTGYASSDSYLKCVWGA